MEAFKDQVQQLLDDRSEPPRNPSQLQHVAAHAGVEGQSGEAIRSAINGKRGRNKTEHWLPDLPAITAIAEALGVDPWHFDAYRLVYAQRLLNPQAMGFDSALGAAESLLSAVGVYHAKERPPDAALESTDSESR